jgi:uncharacterized protein YchJ
MGLFSLGRTISSSVTQYKEILARYQRFRPIRLRLNNELVRRLSRDVLDEGGKKLGILRRGVFVFDNEDESSVLMDYCVYNVFRRGRNAVEQYLADCPPDPDSEEMACLRAMQQATYALVVVLRVEPGVGCHVRNLFTDETRLLVDMGFAKTARPGTVMATRLLDFGAYIATGGAALPLGILDTAELEAWEQKMRAVLHDAGYDPAELIRACLQQGASSHVRYEGMSSEGGAVLRIDSRPADTRAQPRRAIAKRVAGKPAENRRCRCGSGKMFKNCCGKSAKAVS